MNNDIENGKISLENVEKLKEYKNDRILLYAIENDEYIALDTTLINIDEEGKNVEVTDNVFVKFINDDGGIIDIISLDKDKLIYQNTDFNKNKVR